MSASKLSLAKTFSEDYDDETCIKEGVKIILSEEELKIQKNIKFSDYKTPLYVKSNIDRS